MNARMLWAAALTLSFSSLALAAEEAPPPSEAARAEAGQPAPHDEFSKRVQERLQQLGFYTGPINGDIGPNTQAALAQFQLSVPIPASGALDDATIAALGLERPQTEEPGGAPGDASAGATPAQPPAGSGGKAAGGSSAAAEARPPSTTTQDAPPQATCDGLIGPEKEKCLKEGGTVETSTRATGGPTGSN